MVATLTRGSIAPGVHAGSGSPPWLTQPVVLVRGAGTQAAASVLVGVGAAGATVAAGAADATVGVGAAGTTVGVGAAGATVGLNAAAGATAAEQPLSASIAVRIMHMASARIAPAVIG